MKKKGPPSRKAAAFELPAMLLVEETFEEIVGLIQQARERTYQAANTELVSLYWQVGRYIHEKLETAAWGEGVVDQLARHLARTLPGLRGFTRRNLFRMRQFYATYAGDEKVSALLTQLPWTHNLIILGQSKHPEEREFYLRMAIRERWSSREVERQFRLGAFERAVLQPASENPALGILLCASKDAEVVDYADRIPAEEDGARGQGLGTSGGPVP